MSILPINFSLRSTLFYWARGLPSLSDHRYTLQTLGFALVILGFFLFLLGLFVGPIQTGEPWFWGSWNILVSFYSGIGFVIVGSVLLSTSRSMMADEGRDTPALSGEQRLSKRARLSHFPIDLGIGLMAGVVVSAANTFAAWDRFNSSSGFPFPVKSLVPGCFGPFPGGCFTYDPWALILDGVLWTGLAFVGVAITDLITARLSHSVEKSVTYGSPKSIV